MTMAGGLTSTSSCIFVEFPGIPNTKRSAEITCCEVWCGRTAAVCFSLHHLVSTSALLIGRHCALWRQSSNRLHITCTTWRIPSKLRKIFLWHQIDQDEDYRYKMVWDSFILILLMLLLISLLGLRAASTPMSTGSAHLKSATHLVSVEEVQHFFCPYWTLPNTPLLGSAT